MIVAVEQGKIRLYSPVGDEDFAANLEVALDEEFLARRRLRTLEGDLSSTDLLPAKERLNAAEDRLRDLFSETVTVEQAGTLVARLSGAIVQAKAAGRFNREVGD